MFGEIKTAKVAICPDLRFWCLKALSVVQKSPILCVLRSFCSEQHSSFTRASWLQKSSGPSMFGSLHLALTVNFPVFQNLSLHSFDNLNKSRGCICALQSLFALVSPWIAWGRGYHLTCLPYSQIHEFTQGLPSYCWSHLGVFSLFFLLWQQLSC